jgi:hypothetical protein
MSTGALRIRAKSCSKDTCLDLIQQPYRHRRCSDSFFSLDGQNPVKCGTHTDRRGS